MRVGAQADADLKWNWSGAQAQANLLIPGVTRTHDQRFRTRSWFQRNHPLNQFFARNRCRKSDLGLGQLICCHFPLVTNSGLPKRVLSSRFGAGCGVQGRGASQQRLSSTGTYNFRPESVINSCNFAAGIGYIPPRCGGRTIALCTIPLPSP